MYGYGYGPVAGAGYDCGCAPVAGVGYGPVAGVGHCPGKGFALIVVLFILLIIIGASWGKC